MSNLNEIKNYFLENKDKAIKDGFSENDIAIEFEIWPSEAKKDLNELVKDNVLRVEGKKKCIYFLQNNDAKEKSSPLKESVTTKRNEDEPFSDIIGFNGSLKNQVQMAQAAVMYPPNGLHTLIIGESGVGKSMFAEEMWNFKKNFEKNNEQIPFVSFNCAEYADNPQLLLSHLFGYCKGAFTGAVSDTDGLVEKANGGILFLDEIHRLSSVGQEMFFTLIDKGIYRRLGETATHKVNLMIIGATTENPDSVMLKTFMRRVPVVISIPSLSNRPLKEHIELINFFLCQESTRLNLPIRLSGEAFRKIVIQETKANVGDLKNILQLCCAKSYCSYLMNLSSVGQDSFLTINEDDIPSGIVDHSKEKLAISNSLASHFMNDGIYVLPGNKTRVKVEDQYELSMDLYAYVEDEIQKIQSSKDFDFDAERKLVDGLEKRYNEILKRIRVDFQQDEGVISSLISNQALETARDVLQKAGDYFNRYYNSEVLAALALHFQQMKERIEENSYLPKKSFDKNTWINYEDEISFVTSILPLISEKMGVRIPEEEITFLAMFIHQSHEKEKSIGLIIVAHGESTATSMADFANRLLSTDHAAAVNVPISKGVNSVKAELVEMIKSADQGNGVILLVDMGSFLALKEEIEKETGSRIRIIPNVSSVLVLEATKTIISTSEDLDSTYERLVGRYRMYFSTLFQNEHNGISAPVVSSENKSAAIIICSTGKGSATKLVEVLLQQIPQLEDYDLYPMSITEDVDSVAHYLGTRLKFVAGNFNPKVEGVPFYSTEAILMGNGISNISFLVQNQMMSGEENHENTHNEIIEKIRGNVHVFTPGFDENKVLECVLGIISDLESIKGEEFETEVFVRVFMHTATLIKRIYDKDEAPMPAWGYEYLMKNRNKSERIRAVLDIHLKKFDESISDPELIYFMIGLPDE